jgi:hypothetical protein
MILALLLFTESLFYQHTTVEKLALGKVKMTRAEVSGIVTLVKKEDDGDLHIRVSDGKHWIVAECMPEIPACVPKSETASRWKASRATTASTSGKNYTRSHISKS